jgi:hypothetical protein
MAALELHQRTPVKSKGLEAEGPGTDEGIGGFTGDKDGLGSHDKDVVATRTGEGGVTLVECMYLHVRMHASLFKYWLERKSFRRQGRAQKSTQNKCIVRNSAHM